MLVQEFSFDFYSFYVSEICNYVPLLCSWFFISLIMFITTALKSLCAYSNISFISVSSSINWCFLWLWINFPAYLHECLPVFYCGCCIVEFLGFPLEDRVLFWHLVNFLLQISSVLLFARMGLELSLFCGCNQITLLLRYNLLG